MIDAAIKEWSTEHSRPEFSKKVFMELWKPVPGTNRQYYVSASGRVRSVTRSIRQKSRGGKIYTRTKIGKMLRPGLNAQGYPTVVLGRKRGTATVHSLVLLAFKGNPLSCNECRHRNGKRYDPRLENLEYGTRAENIQDAIRHGTWHMRYGKLRQKLGVRVQEIRDIYHYGDTSFRKLSAQFNVSAHTIRNIVQKRGAYAVY